LFAAFLKKIYHRRSVKYKNGHLLGVVILAGASAVNAKKEQTSS